MKQTAILLKPWPFPGARNWKGNARFRKWAEARSSYNIHATAPWKVLACAILISSIAQSAFAAVSRIEILHREPLAGGKSFGKVGAYSDSVSAAPSSPRLRRCCLKETESLFAQNLNRVLQHNRHFSADLKCHSDGPLLRDKLSLSWPYNSAHF